MGCKGVIPCCSDLSNAVDFIECHGKVTKSQHYTDDRAGQSMMDYVGLGLGGQSAFCVNTGT